MSDSLFSYKTRYGSSPEGKAKVFFTCHPDDFDLYFESVCNDILEAYDCAVYYTQDMSADLFDENSYIDLERMSLFVIPISLNLLLKPNRTMDFDFLFAANKNIPILPLMMDSDAKPVYSRPDKFGEMQYLSPYKVDATTISYKVKLKKYLDSVLVSDELIKRIKQAFDAYIFLSYRKTDRKLANDLMKMIHRNPECEDIAIWFDEFLTPGESFRESIERILSDSKLFAMLVTPNLLERNENGTPNFIVDQEYPAAIKLGKTIFPAEMVFTDHEQLSQVFPGIPYSADATDERGFNRQLLDALVGIAVSDNNNDPEHNYLIGLAYLGGIDVEINLEKGLKLITKAAEAGLIDAITKLAEMHKEGNKVKLDYRKELYWREKAYERSIALFGENHPDTLNALNLLSVSYRLTGDYKKAVETSKKCYELCKKMLGEEHPDTLTALSNLSVAYRMVGDYRAAYDMAALNLNILRKTHDEMDDIMLKALNNFANLTSNLGFYQQAFEYQKQCYDLFRKKYGEENPNTLLTLNGLANAYAKLEKNDTALELHKKCYELYVKVLGEEHPDTLRSMKNLGICYRKTGNTERALELAKKCYDIHSNVFGDEHPLTLEAMSDLATVYDSIKHYETALKLREMCIDSQRCILGESHPSTLITMNNLAISYKKIRNYSKAIEVGKECFDIYKKALGSEHPETLNAMKFLAGHYEAAGELKEALCLYSDCLILQREVLGLDHPMTMTSEKKIVDLTTKVKFKGEHSFNNGEYKEALPMFEGLYYSRSKLLGEDGPETLEAKDWLARTCNMTSNFERAQKLFESLYEYYCNTFGKEDYPSLYCLNCMAIVCKNMKEYSKAIDYASEYCLLCNKVYGSEDPKSIDAESLLNWIKELFINDGLEKFKMKTTGRKEYKDGKYYEGELVDGKPEGRGTFYYNGGHWTGEFKNGMFNGQGKCYDDPDPSNPGLVYDNREYDMRTIHCGVWKDNKKDGRFVVYNIGVPYDQEFKNGVRVASPLHYEIPDTSERPDSGSIKCYYCGQSGFIIETANETLVFDWYRAAIPPLEPSKPVYIFISHVHLDHYNSRIFGLADKYDVREIYLGLSGTASEQGALDKIPQSMEDILCSFRGEQYLETDFGSVKSLKSTDMGVAFIVEAGGYRFFHAGDLFANAQLPFNTYKKRLEKRLSGMNGSGYSTGLSIESTARKFYPNEVTTSESQFKKYAAPLKNAGRIDYAMLPLDPRWDDFAFRTIDYYLSIADIKRFTPMHLWEKYDYVTDYIKHNPDAAGKIIAVNPDGCRMLQSIELNKPYFVKLW